MTKPDPNGCIHESWECLGGWHKCADCRTGLGTRDFLVEEHGAENCDLCAPVEVCVCTEETYCILCHPGWTTDGIPLQREVSAQQDEMDVPYGMPSKFVTKDSGKREEYDSGMRRDTQEGKPRFDLLVVDGLPMDQQLLTRWAQLMERGAQKYGEKNWQLANSEEELNRFRASAARHFFQWMMGETDEDHAAAVCYNLSSYTYLDWKLRNADESVQ
jgi:hypothetical protein